MKKELIASLKENPYLTLEKLTNNDIANIIQEANYEYYHGKKPLFGDNIYDLIREYFEQTDPMNPVLLEIGAQIKGEKEKLPYNMASLDKIKGDTKVLDRFKDKFMGNYVISDKLDGNSAMFMSNNNKRKLWSRGNGSIGQDLSYLIPYIKGLPIVTDKKELTIRGEVIISKVSFEKVKNKFSNGRNLVAGILNSKKINQELIKLVEFVSYELIAPSMKPYNGLDFIKDLGFKVVWYKLIDEKNFTSENLSDILINRRDKSPYEIDGIVVNHNEINPRVLNNPKYAFAFKSIINANEVEVIISDVEWNVSKDKRIIPVVKFSPISLDGVNIKRATAHNAKFIRDNIIGPGSRITIIRSGDIIPKIVKILSPSETGKACMPKYDYIWGKTNVDIYITDDDSNELALKNLEYFFKKLEIEGLGPGNIKKLSDAGFKSPKSILNINKSQLLKVEGFKDKIAEKLYLSIHEKNKKINCLLLMSASNTIGSGIGVRKIKMVTDVYPKIITHRYIPTMQQLISIKGIEETSAEMFITGLPRFFKFIDDNEINCDQSIEKTKVTVAPKTFAEEKIVFTGFRNKEWEKIIEDGGGSVTTTVSNRTTLVVCKADEEKTSGKAQKAFDLGIKVLSKDEFIKIYKLE